jgi:integrase
VGVRWKKYFKECKGKRIEGDRYGKVIVKGVECEGKKSKQCPDGITKDKPCGNWAVEFRDCSGRWTSKIFPEIKTRTHAMEAYKAITIDICRGILGLPILRERVTLEAYAKKYLERIKDLMPENTLISHGTSINSILKHLGDCELSKLNLVLIQGFCSDRIKIDGVKASTVNQNISILRSILSMAVEEGIINKNPLNSKSFKGLKAEEVEKKALTNDEIRKILELPSGWERMVILIGLFTGLRLMDVVSLKWENIDFNNRMISVFVRKTDRVTRIPISDFLIGELKEFKPKSKTNEHLFYDGKINHNSESKFSNHFRKVFRGMGMPVSFHSLRHTNATRVVEVSKDVATATKLLDHRDIATTMRYVHRDLNAKREAVERLTAHYLDIGENPTEYERGTKHKIA